MFLVDAYVVNVIVMDQVLTRFRPGLDGDLSDGQIAMPYRRPGQIARKGVVKVVAALISSHENTVRASLLDMIARNGDPCVAILQPNGVTTHDQEVVIFQRAVCGAFQINGLSSIRSLVVRLGCRPLDLRLRESKSPKLDVRDRLIHLADHLHNAVSDGHRHFGPSQTIVRGPEI